MRDAIADQATGLRRMFGRRGPIVLSVAGDGAALVTLNLAAALARVGQQVLVLDVTNGEAAAGLGLKSRYELAHVLAGDRALADTLLAGPPGIALLPARRGLLRLAQEEGTWQNGIERALGACSASFNVWLVNGLPPSAGAGNAPVLVVLAPTADALTAAYAQIKSLANDRGQRDFRIVVRRARSESAAMAAYRNVADTARRFLSARLDYCGCIPRDCGEALADSLSPSGRVFARLAESVLSGALPALPGAVAS